MALGATQRVAIIDVAAVGGVSLLYVVFEALDVPKRWSFVVAGVALAIYAIYLFKRRNHSLHEMGLRRDNLGTGLVPVGIFTIVAGLGLVAWTVAQGGDLGAKSVLSLLVLYPVWAVVQQFGFQGLFHRGLMVLVPSRTLQVLGTGTAFACVHWGNPTLFGLTFVAGIAWSLLYRRWPNLWLLAGSHTVLAALAYPLVLGDNPLPRL